MNLLSSITKLCVSLYPMMLKERPCMSWRSINVLFFLLYKHSKYTVNPFYNASPYIHCTWLSITRSNNVMPNESNSLATKKYIYIYIILKNEKCLTNQTAFVLLALACYEYRFSACELSIVFPIFPCTYKPCWR